jgi:hypothetical protein
MVLYLSFGVYFFWINIKKYKSFNLLLDTTSCKDDSKVYILSAMVDKVIMAKALTIENHLNV